MDGLVARGAAGPEASRLTRTILERLKRSILPDRDGDYRRIRRALTEQGKAHWKSYVVIVLLMAVVAATTAMFAYLLSHMINDVYFRRGFGGVVALCVTVMLLFCIKGFASYFQAIMLARVNNRITAANQQRMFDKLVREGMEYFADRHSSRFTASFLQGASAESGVLNVLILALGRDLLSLIGLVVVMVMQNPVLSLIGIVVMPPAVFGVRKLLKRVKALALVQFSKGANILSLTAGNRARVPGRQSVQSRRRDVPTDRSQDIAALKRLPTKSPGFRTAPARSWKRSAAARSPGTSLRRLPHARDRSAAGRIHLVHRRFSAGV